MHSFFRYLRKQGSSDRLTAKQVADWVISLPTGTDFTFATITEQVGTGSRNTMKKGLELAQEQGIKFDNKTPGYFTRL